MVSYAIVNREPGSPDEGRFLTSYDPDWRPDGRAVYPTGRVEWTADPAEAMSFRWAALAMTFWRQSSTTVPYRPDGEPNRPLTTITVSVEPLP